MGKRFVWLGADTMEKMTKYALLAQRLATEIQTGHYRVGDRLPSENELATYFGLSRQTVRQALAQLADQGLISRRQGSGSIVIPTVSDFASRQCSYTAAVITTYIGEYIFPDIMRGIEQVLSLNQYAPLISATRNRVDSERRILLNCLDRLPDGLIVEGTKTALPNPNIDLYQKLYDLGVPVVFINGFYPDLPEPIFVVADDRQGGRDATSLLIRKGHTQIGGVFKSDDIQGHRRYAGFIQAMREAGVALNDDRILWYTTENRSAVLSNYALSALEDCTAVVCYNDEVALQVINLMRTAHRRVPEDLAVVSFDNSYYSEVSPIGITSFTCHKEQIGILAAQKLLSLIDGNPQQSTLLPWTLVERESV